MKIVVKSSDAISIKQEIFLRTLPSKKAARHVDLLWIISLHLCDLCFRSVHVHITQTTLTEKRKKKKVDVNVSARLMICDFALKQSNANEK